MVVNSVAEEYPLRINEEIGIFLTLPVSVIFLDYVLKHMTHRQVHGAVLIPKDVASVFRCLAQMVDIFLLFESQRIPSRHTVSHNLQIGKFVDEIFEIRRDLIAHWRSARNGAAHNRCSSNHFHYRFHIIRIIYFFESHFFESKMI